jgi:hypothetical protein
MPTRPAVADRRHPPSRVAKIAYTCAKRPAATASRPAIAASMGFARSEVAPTQQEASQIKVCVDQDEHRTEPNAQCPSTKLQACDDTPKGAAGHPFATHSAVLPRAADVCIPRIMRKPNGARSPRCCFRMASGCWIATHSAVLTRAAYDCFSRMMRKPNRGRLAPDAALLLLCVVGLLVCHGSSCRRINLVNDAPATLSIAGPEITYLDPPRATTGAPWAPRVRSIRLVLASKDGSGSSAHKRQGTRRRPTRGRVLLWMLPGLSLNPPFAGVNRPGVDGDRDPYHPGRFSSCQKARAKPIPREQLRQRRHEDDASFPGRGFVSARLRLAE